MISSVILAAALQSDTGMSQFRRYAMDVSEVITTNTVMIGDGEAMSAEAAIKAAFECKKIIGFIDNLNSGFYSSLCEFGILSEESHDDEDTISSYDVENLSLCAEIVKGDITQLSYIFKMASSTSAWKPHSKILETIEKDTIFSLSRLHNTIRDTNLALKQLIDSTPHSDVNMVFDEGDMPSFKKSVSSSHEIAGLETPKWLQ